MWENCVLYGNNSTGWQAEPWPNHPMLIHSFCISICIGWFAVKTFFISLRSDFRSNNNRNSYRLVHSLHFNAYTLRLFIMSLFFDSFFCCFFCSWFQYIFKTIRITAFPKRNYAVTLIGCNILCIRSNQPLNHTAMCSRTQICMKYAALFLLHWCIKENIRIDDRQWHQWCKYHAPSFSASFFIHFAADFSYFSPDFLLLFFFFLFSCINNMFYPFSIYLLDDEVPLRLKWELFFHIRFF